MRNWYLLAISPAIEEHAIPEYCTRVQLPTPLGIERDDPERLYRNAVGLAIEAEAIELDKTSSSADDALRRRYLDLVVDLLGKAIDAGLEHPERIQEDPELSYIRKYAGFESLQKDLSNRQK